LKFQCLPLRSAPRHFHHEFNKGHHRVVFDFFRRRKLSEEGEKRLVVALARAEDAIIEAHVDCALEVIEAVGDEMPIDRVLEVYLEALEENPQRAEIVARRVLSRLNSTDTE
jgi:hypothetical protein